MRRLALWFCVLACSCDGSCSGSADDQDGGSVDAGVDNRPRAIRIDQVTSNDARDFCVTAARDGTVAWLQMDAEYRPQVMMYRDGVVTPITSDTTWKLCPVADEGELAWLADDNVFFYDGSEVTQITDDVHRKHHVALHGGVIAWVSEIAGGWEVFRHESGETTQLTSDGFINTGPTVRGGQVVWTAQMGYASNVSEILLHDGQTTRRLTDDDIYDAQPALSDGRVAWTRGVCHDTQAIFVGDVAGATQLTDQSGFCFSPRIDDRGVFFLCQGSEPSDPVLGALEVHHWDGEKTTVLTANGKYDDNLQLMNGGIAWERILQLWSESEPPRGEILYTRGHTIQKVAAFDYDPDVSILLPVLSAAGDVLAWTHFDGSDAEVMVGVVTGDPHDGATEEIAGSPAFVTVDPSCASVETQKQLYGLHLSDSSQGHAVGYHQWVDGMKRGAILRYRDNTWSEVEDLPNVSASWSLAKVWSPSDLRGWAAGDDVAQRRGVVLGFDGEAWSEEALPEVGEWGVTGLSFASEEAGWICGWVMTNAGGTRGTVLRRQGGTWSEEDLPSVSGQWHLYDIAAPSSSTAIAVGVDNENQQAIVLRYAGSSWTVDYRGLQSTGLFAVSYSSAGEGWAVGFDADSTALLLHDAGGAWLDASSSAPEIERMFGVHAPTAGSACAVGNAPDQVLMRKGGVWQAATVTPFWQSGDVAWYTDVHLTSEESGWMVGRYYRKYADHWVILRYSGGDWSLP